MQNIVTAFYCLFKPEKAYEKTFNFNIMFIMCEYDAICVCR